MAYEASISNHLNERAEKSSEFRKRSRALSFPTGYEGSFSHMCFVVKARRRNMVTAVVNKAQVATFIFSCTFSIGIDNAESLQKNRKV